MPAAESRVTFVASRVRMASGLVPFGAATVAIAWLFWRFAATGSRATADVTIPVSALVGAGLALFAYIDVKAIAALRRPASLTIDRDGIAEQRFGETRSAAWDDLGAPEPLAVPTGRGTLFYIAFPGRNGGTINFRSDLYPQDQAQILATIDDARTGRPLTLPAPSGRVGDYLLLALSMALSLGALVYVWVRT